MLYLLHFSPQIVWLSQNQEFQGCGELKGMLTRRLRLRHLHVLILCHMWLLHDESQVESNKLASSHSLFLSSLLKIRRRGGSANLRIWSGIWISGYLHIWISGYLDVWISRYLDSGRKNVVTSPIWTPVRCSLAGGALFLQKKQVPGVLQPKSVLLAFY